MQCPIYAHVYTTFENISISDPYPAQEAGLKIKLRRLQPIIGDYHGAEFRSFLLYKKPFLNRIASRYHPVEA